MDELQAISKTLAQSDVQSEIEEVKSSLIYDLQSLIVTCESGNLSLDDLKSLKNNMFAEKQHCV